MHQLRIELLQFRLFSRLTIRHFQTAANTCKTSLEPEHFHWFFDISSKVNPPNFAKKIALSFYNHFFSKSNILIDLQTEKISLHQPSSWTSLTKNLGAALFSHIARDTTVKSVRFQSLCLDIKTYIKIQVAIVRLRLELLFALLFSFALTSNSQKIFIFPTATVFDRSLNRVNRV